MRGFLWCFENLAELSCCLAGVSRSLPRMFFVVSQEVKTASCFTQHGLSLMDLGDGRW